MNLTKLSFLLKFTPYSKETHDQLSMKRLEKKANKDTDDVFCHTVFFLRAQVLLTVCPRFLIAQPLIMRV